MLTLCSKKYRKKLIMVFLVTICYISHLFIYTFAYINEMAIM